ncbi:hypothetical protein P4907_14215 [Escherichia coli]
MLTQGSQEALANAEPDSHGTVVLWDVLDRIVTPGYGEKDFLNLMDGVEQHLAMVFHRFLEGNAPRLTLTLNGRKIKALGSLSQRASFQAPGIRLRQWRQALLP